MSASTSRLGYEPSEPLHAATCWWRLHNACCVLHVERETSLGNLLGRPGPDSPRYVGGTVRHDMKSSLELMHRLRMPCVLLFHRRLVRRPYKIEEGHPYPLGYHGILIGIPVTSSTCTCPTLPLLHPIGSDGNYSPAYATTPLLSLFGVHEQEPRVANLRYRPAIHMTKSQYDDIHASPMAMRNGSRLHGIGCMYSRAARLQGPAAVEPPASSVSGRPSGCLLSEVHTKSLPCFLVPTNHRCAPAHLSSPIAQAWGVMRRIGRRLLDEKKGCRTCPREGTYRRTIGSYRSDLAAVTYPYFYSFETS